MSAVAKAAFDPLTCLQHTLRTGKEVRASGSVTGFGKEKGKEVVENREKESNSQPQCNQKMKYIQPTKPLHTFKKSKFFQEEQK